MKRTLLFALTVAMSAVLFAAVPTAQTQVREINPTIRIVENAGVDYNAPVLTSFAKKATNATVTDFSTYYVPQSFNSGTPSRGIGYVGLAQIVVPYAEQVPYVDGYGVGGTWTVGGEVVATDAKYYIAEAGKLGGEWELPVLKSNDMPYNDTTTISFSEYQFGAYYTYSYNQLGAGFHNSLLMAPAYLQPMTKCAMYTEVEVDSRGKDTYGQDWTYVTSSLGYAYGTKMPDPFNEDTTTITYLDEIMVLVDNAATMYIDHISLGIFTLSTSVFNSEDDHVKLTLYPTSKDAEGKIVIDYENPYATAVATIDDYVPVQEGAWYGLLNFYFEEKNALGVMSEVPAVVEGTFAAVLSEYNNGTADFGIITDYYTPYSGDTYLRLTDGSWTSLWQGGGNNLLMNFYAIFPTVLEIPTEVKVALEGETVELTLPSNVWYEDMEIDTEEWIAEDGESVVKTVVVEGAEEEEFQYQVALTLDVEAADAPRTGVVEINALGKIYTINVIQGDAATGVENVESVLNGKSFNLLGVEVDENYKGIVIKNGQKFIQ